MLGKETANESNLFELDKKIDKMVKEMRSKDGYASTKSQ
jgi:hypothetical protein